MKKFLSIVLATTLLTPAFAQKMGMSNSDAPTIKQSIMAGEAKISLDYTAITWASGKTMSALADKDKGAGMRKRVNDSGPDSPLATLTTSVDLKVGDLMLAAGEYAVFFTIGDDMAWSINFKNKDKVLTMKLPAQDAAGHEHKRLVLSLYAGDDTGAGLYFGFGTKAGMCNLMPAGKGGAKEASDKK